MLAVLCALMLCALGASGASAAGGTTLVTCKKGGTTLDFSRAHCASADKVPLGTGTFSHFKVEKGVATTITGTNAGTKNETKEAASAVLISTLGFVRSEIICTTVSSTGETENQEPSSENHKIIGKNIVITYTGCTVPIPLGQECKVKEGKITTNSLKSESVEDTLVFTPTTGTSFTTINIEGCKTAALNGPKNVTGTVKAIPDGATLKVNIAQNAESTLEFGGQKAGLTLTETVRGKKVGGGEAAEPLSATTTPLVLGG
jgi:hypothetical protein